jgi:NAD(P)H-hydrate epimerase
MMGAAILATKSALKTGVGMVKILLPQGQSPVLLQHCPEAMAVEWPMTTDEASQHLGAEVQFQNHEVTVQRLTELSTWADAVLVGPGLGLDDATMSVFQQWLPHCHTPCLLDADALSLLAKCMGQHNEPEVTHNASPLHDSKTWLKPQHLLTPHRGEAKRLWGVAPEPSMDWIAFCQSIAKQHGVQIHFKGAPSLTAWSNGDIVVNNSGSSILSTAGSGDVLSGMAASLMAQGCIAQIAGSLGAYLHGRCADRCSQKGEFGHTAMDLCEHIGAVMSNPFQPES